MRNFDKRVIMISTMTAEELGVILEQIESFDYAFEYVRGRSGVNCLRYWDKNYRRTNEIEL